MQRQCRNRHFIGQVDQTFVPYRSTNIWCVLNRAAISQSELMVMVIPSTEYRDWRLAVQPRFRDQFKTNQKPKNHHTFLIQAILQRCSGAPATGYKYELCKYICSTNVLLLTNFHHELHYFKRVCNGSPSKSQLPLLKTT